MENFELRLRSGENATQYISHPALYKHKELLEKFVSNGIFGVFHSKSRGFYVEECCDNWFNTTLTKEQCLELSEMFKDIASYIE